MTRRFDRDTRGRKIHMQSFGALRHFDYNVAGAYAYEQVMQTIRALGLGMSVVEEQYRRTVFNIVARNQDDHVKNIAFLMDRSGRWRLSPAYDVAYAYNPLRLGTREHRMSTGGKRDDFERADLARFAESFRPQENRRDWRCRSSGLRGRHVAAVRGGSRGGGRASPADRKGAPDSAALTVDDGSRCERGLAPRAASASPAVRDLLAK